MLNSRSFTIGLGIVLVGGGIVLADTPVMRSILRRPAPQTPSASAGEVAEAPAERKFKGFTPPIVLPRGRAQAENPREATPPTLPDQPVDVPGLEVTIGGDEPNVTQSEVNFVPVPAVDDGDSQSPATRPIFEAPQTSFVPEVPSESPVPQNLQPKVSPEVNPRPNFPNQPPQRMNQFPNPNQEQPGFIQRRRMRRAGAANTQPQQPTQVQNGGQALVQQDGPSILDIEMPEDAIPETESRGTTAAVPASLEVSREGKKPLFSTR